MSCAFVCSVVYVRYVMYELFDLYVCMYDMLRYAMLCYVMYVWMACAYVCMCLCMYMMYVWMDGMLRMLWSALSECNVMYDCYVM